jgi:hypothetical protein
MRGMAVQLSRNLGLDYLAVSLSVDDYVNNALERVFTQSKSLVGTLTLTVVSGTAAYSLIEAASGSTPAKHWFSFDSIKWAADEDITHRMINPRHLSITDTDTDPPFWFVQNEIMTFHPTPSESASPVLYGAYYPKMAGVVETVDFSVRDRKLFTLALKSAMLADYGALEEMAKHDIAFENALRAEGSSYLRQHEQTIRQYDMIGE